MLKAPFPWFGGKRRVAEDVWCRFGDVANYVEPFFGSGAVLLGRPHEPRIETVNDLDGFVANFWRSVKYAPEQVAEYADNPVNENDLHARHIWLVHQRETLSRRLEGNPEWYDAKIAGWWCWGVCTWIGTGFCSGKGPWGLADGQLVHLGNAGQGVNRQRVHLSNAGQGVNRKRVHLGDAGQGVNRKRVHLGNAGQGVKQWMIALAHRLERVRVASGDWSRVCGPSITSKLGITGVFLDPPYSAEERNPELYRRESLIVAHDVRAWALSVGGDKSMRIALCGYEGEHKMPESWECFEWATGTCYNSTKNIKRERIWFSPHCIKGNQLDLF